MKKTIQTKHVFPNDLNIHGTLFGGHLLAWIDEVGSIAAIRHVRLNNHERASVVTASFDQVDFLCPVRIEDLIVLEASVIATGRTSMEVFVKAVAENLQTSEKRMAATAFMTFVAIDEFQNKIEVTKVRPETEEEIFLNSLAAHRKEQLPMRREWSKKLAETVSID